MRSLLRVGQSVAKGTLTFSKSNKSNRQKAGVLQFILKAASRFSITLFWSRLFAKRRTGFPLIVSNAYWANSVPDAEEWLRPFAGRLADLTVSSDLFHCNDTLGERPQNALTAAKWLNIPTGMISIAQPEADAQQTHGQIEDEGAVMFRGRAAKMLVEKATSHPWEGFDSCPHEDLREPGRVHLDPLGSIHICQVITIGNVFETPLKEICEKYNADTHPICGPLLAGGPAALVTEYNLPHASSYADACHLCYEARITLRERFPQYLNPDQMYGVME